jgi:hypothetical protein
MWEGGSDRANEVGQNRQFSPSYVFGYRKKVT